LSSQPASRVGRLLRTIAWSLFLAFVFGFLIGTWIRTRLEEPVRYIGGRENPAHPTAVATLFAGTLSTRPGDVGHPETGILMTRQHEEEIG